jgi:hypothetical protein
MLVGVMTVAFLSEHLQKSQLWSERGRGRVPYETSFDSKQPKLVSTLSETRRLFRLFRFNIETRRFGVSIEPKQKENNRNKPKKGLKLVYF